MRVYRQVYRQVYLRLFIFLFSSLGVGCASQLKATSVEQVKTSRTKAFTAFVVTFESLKQETEAIAIVGENKSFEISTTDAATLEIPGAKVFLVELPPDEYRVDGHAFGGRMYHYSAFGGEPPKFEAVTGKITVLPALNLIPTDHRMISNNPVGTALVNMESVDRLKRTFPDRSLILGYKK